MCAMSSSYTNYNTFPGTGQLLASNFEYSYGQDDGSDSKSLMSMINHPSYSPALSGPLSTPPRSRNGSRPPEQPPDQMMYEDVGGSQSDSPTSIPTPDGSAFEVEMLDSEAMRNFYFQPHENMVSTQIQQDNIPAMASNYYFSTTEGNVRMVMLSSPANS